MAMLATPRLLVVALGGNAILRRGDDGGIGMQFARAEACMRQIALLAGLGDELVLTHGNGPVVGNIVLRNELARETVPPMPLYIADAESQGGIGLLLQMSLYDQLRLAGVDRDVASVVTQCVIDADDPAFERPVKPIGPYLDAAGAQRLAALEGWTFAEEPGRGWRRVVASPRPRRIVEAGVIGRLARGGDIVIAAGGGGVPVTERADGTLAGADAVIDKDRASALLALALDAWTLVILMAEDRVYLDYGTPQARPIDVLAVSDAEALVASGDLAAGSVRPKVESCARFVRKSGRPAVICAVDALRDALEGRAGTRIVPDAHGPRR